MIPTRIGQKFEGGYFAGINRIEDCVYAVLVAPKSTECSIPFKAHCSSTPNTQLVNDGWSNTNAMNDTEHLAAQYCRSLTVGGHTDLYLPSRDELELCYRNLKPTGRGNTTSGAGNVGNLSSATGTNLNSIPTGSAYTSTNPAQTIVTTFQTGNVEAFETSSVDAFAVEWYWTSTESSAFTNDSLVQNFSDGFQLWDSKTNVYKVRSVCRVLILTE